VTERGVLHATGDGWSLVARGSLEAIGGDAKAIYAVGANGTIVSSTDGKAWTRRASGVTYALSSIMAANGEIFVGSVDGPPLRSTDGIAWKPMTGMVPKGHVWSGTLAAAGDVYALTTPAPTPVFIPSVTPSPNTKIHEQMTNREALAARLDVEKDSKLPFRRDLIRIATTRFEDGFPMLPRLARAGTPISLDVTSKTGCGSEPLPPQRPNAKFSGTLTCTMTCSEVSATLKLANTTSGAKLTSRIPITSCSLQAAAVKDLIEVMEIRLTNSHLDGLKQRIAKLKPGTDERLDTLAAYVLDGGPDPTYRTLLAAELGVSSQWPGLFWNRAPSTTRIPTACKANQMIVRDAEESTRSGLHRDALDTYELLTDCEPSYSVDAYRAACRARNPQRAAFHFANMAGRFQLKYLPECTDAGIDPRRPPTNP
jgi:hypothetical protein